MKNDKTGQDQVDFKIDQNGQWFHNGAPINRKALAKLFSDRALHRDEDGRYWLKTPYEKYPVEVVDVPFIIVDYERTKEGLTVITNMEEKIEIGPDHPVELRVHDLFHVKLPYVEVRGGMYARFGRSVYYNLIEEYGAQIESRGAIYPLGDLDVDAAKEGGKA